MKTGTVFHRGNFHDRILKPALERARVRLAELHAAADDNDRARLPGEIPDVHPHSFRHTHAAWLIASGASPLEIQRRMGHADIATTTRLYGHLTQETVNETLLSLQTYMAPLMSPGLAAVIPDSDYRTPPVPHPADAALPLVLDDDDEDQEGLRAA
ncbi:tyrosine-type recombinase/integrase [Jannaschia sp. R86511]|uniref:tyrosine-type recombinase/integrase n=1 Tax=Jannaschia sp. R86511 TaxID=3093853 RepID=UPI0036D2896B